MRLADNSYSQTRGSTRYHARPSIPATTRRVEKSQHADLGLYRVFSSPTDASI